MATDFLGRMLRHDLPNPNTAPELFDGILTRRVMAFLIDCVIMGAAILTVTLVAGILGIFTFGLTWLSIPLIVPLTFVVYYAVTLRWACGPPISCSPRRGRRRWTGGWR
mgnify:CR=1 FL=1